MRCSPCCLESAHLIASHRLIMLLPRAICWVAQGKVLLASWPVLMCTTTSSAQLSSAACRSWLISASLALGSITAAGTTLVRTPALVAGASGAGCEGHRVVSRCCRTLHEQQARGWYHPI
jgi:hypothetical protein